MISDEALVAYLDGEAESDRALEIQTALALDPVLRARLAELEGIDRDLRAAFDAMLDHPVPERLVQAARAGRAPALAARVRAPRWAAGPAAWLGAGAGAIRAAPWWIAGALAAQVALLAVAALAVRPATDVHTYHALSAAAPAPAGNLVVIFRPDTSARTISTTLRELDARVVDGPTAADAWLLRAPADRRASVLAELQRRSDVVMAAPVDSAGAR
jgi:anti-sigma factor RsiW